jgi:general secretion pathway protein D
VGSQSEKKIVLKITAPKTVKVNDEFKVDVVVSDVTNMYNGKLVLQFDPVLLEFVGAEEGGFLKSDGKPTSFQHTFNRIKGRVNLNLYRIGNVGGASGSGTLAVLTFKAMTKGSAKLEINNAYYLTPGGSKPLTSDVISTTTEVH